MSCVNWFIPVGQRVLFQGKTSKEIFLNTLSVKHRRLIFAILNIFTFIALVLAMCIALSPGGITSLDLLLVLLFAITIPFNSVAFWNAVIGFFLAKGSKDLAKGGYKYLSDTDDKSPITTRTAIISCIRHEDTEQVCKKLDIMLEGLLLDNQLDRFTLFVLSDSTLSHHIKGERAYVDMLTAKWHGQIEVLYRRRDVNTGFKPGNIAEFCAHWGNVYDFMLVLDADSLMDTKCILRMVRTMQNVPSLGILQTLMTGLPSKSAFARPMQFGIRMLVGGFSAGHCWWSQDVGSYWGHNALIRIAPFIQHCQLPKLRGKGPLSGWIRCHDHVEAALMRRAGYEVRVMLTETGSWEETPPTLIEYLKRDLRWCHGNLQYFRLLQMPKLHPLSKLNFILVNSGFIASSAWVLMMITFTVSSGLHNSIKFQSGIGTYVFWATLLMAYSPKISSILSIILDHGHRQRYGGILPVSLGFAGEFLFSALVAPILAVGTFSFMLTLLAGKSQGWNASIRSVQLVDIHESIRLLWPQTLLGAGGILWHLSGGSNGYGLISTFYLFNLVSIPLAIISSHPKVGEFFALIGAWKIPEERHPPISIARLMNESLHTADKLQDVMGAVHSSC